MIPQQFHTGQEKYNFRLISGVRNFENFISGFRAYHHKMRNQILGGVIGSIFEIQECFVPHKSIFDLFGEKSPARMVTVNDIDTHSSLDSRLCDLPYVK